jgi:hypothetical protein
MTLHEILFKFALNGGSSYAESEAITELRELIEARVPLEQAHEIEHDEICHLHETEYDKGHNSCRKLILKGYDELFGEKK